MIIKLYICVPSRDEKQITIERDGVTKKFTTNALDLVDFIRKLLAKENLKLEQFTDFIPIPSESFTGQREAIVICNTLKHFVKNSPMSELYKLDYHKAPNINIS
ncbi:hypothetical protein KA001_02940 [Patescibacteria group bacterium]|nr:hypothetical protein [Patescibacteria group bacterium]